MNSRISSLNDLQLGFRNKLKIVNDIIRLQRKNKTDDNLSLYKQQSKDLVRAINKCMNHKAALQMTNLEFSAFYTELANYRLSL